MALQGSLDSLLWGPHPLQQGGQEALQMNRLGLLLDCWVPRWASREDLSRH